MLLENKVAIVTGAASGIGKDIKPQRAPEWAPFSPTETDCMAEHGVVANRSQPARRAESSLQIPCYMGICREFLRLAGNLDWHWDRNLRADQSVT